MTSLARLERAVTDLLAHRGLGKSICPSDVARAQRPNGDWTEKAAYADVYRGVDSRKRPERYRVGKGEQGVLIAEPYKSELLPLWRFKTPAIARDSSRLVVDERLPHVCERIARVPAAPGVRGV